MTHAVITILIALALLLLLNIIILVILIWCKKSKPIQKKNTDYLIVYASQSGNAENLARQTALQLQNIGSSVDVFNIQNIKVEHLKQAQKTLWIVSTYGEGDAPDTARQFIKEVMSQSIDLSHQHYAVLALGDRHYHQFCQFGQNLNQWLQGQNAQAYFDLVCVDQLKANDLSIWKKQLEKITQKTLISLKDQRWIDFKIKQRDLLNGGSQGHPIYHIRLDYSEAIAWQSGDILEVHCANATDRIHAFLFEHQQIISDVNVESLKYKNLCQTQQSVRENHQDFSDWTMQLEDLNPRDYSIASIPKQGYLELVVRQEISEYGLGLSSGWLTQGLELGETIQARIRTNTSFHLSKNTQPIILIGNGSGIAGLLSHLQQRAEWGYIQNWLIFGERQQQFDHLYAEQIQLWQIQGVLADVDYAFSRDQSANQLNHKRYVQDCLIEKSEQLKQWIARGATIYVCGSLKGMAQGVDQALIQILGTDKVSELMDQNRYLRDVY